MNKAFFSVISFVLCLALLSFVLAAKPGSMPSVSERNMTYGQCVSEHALLKNECFASVKEARAVCRANATETDSCKKAYKKELAQCKSDFKASKNECKKIKHSFFEGARHSFA